MPALKPFVNIRRCFNVIILLSPNVQVVYRHRSRSSSSSMLFIVAVLIKDIELVYVIWL
jgi:hypothetical protein